MGYGFAGYFGMRRESTWGSGLAANTFIEILNENITLSKDRFDYKNVINTMAEPDDIAGMNRLSGDVAFACNPANIGNVLMSTFNQSTVTSIAANFWRHVYTQPTNSNSAFSSQSPSVPYTLEIFRDVGTATQYAGGLATSLSFNYASNQDVRCSVGFLCRGTRHVASQVATFPNSPTKPFKFDQVSLSLGGSATTKIENLTVKIDNQYEGIGSLNLSDDIAKVRRSGFQTVEIDGTLDFSDVVEYTDFVNQEERALSIFALSANSFSLHIEVPRMVYTAFPLGIAGRDRNIVSFNAKGFYHVGSGTGISVTLATVNSYF